jgi:hypothetical protein
MELIYGFPVSAPFNVMHVDGYQAGDLSSFGGTKIHLIAADGMTTFGCSEPVKKVMLTHGICHTIVLDKDSKFYHLQRGL